MASSAVIGLLRVLLSANTAEFSAAMKRSTDEAKAWSKDLKQVGQQATQVGAALTKTLTLPIAGVGLAAAKLAIEFESSFAGVRKTVDGTEPQLAELAQGFRDLSKTIPVNVNDLNRLGEAAGALGIPRDKIVEFASVMAKLGVSTDLTADQAANGIARIQNIFGAAGKDTENFASTLVALGNAGASTEKEIVEMAQRIAGAGNTVGLSQAQVLAFASTLSSVGINAEAGGSAISRIFLKINDAVLKGGSGLAEFARVAGTSSAQFKQAFQEDAAKATQMFIEGLGRLKASGENINATIEGLTGKNIILKDTLFRLSGAGKLLNDQLAIADKAWTSNTALAKEAGERFKTTESQMILLGNRVKDVGITLGIALGPAIGAALRGLNALIPVIEKMAGMFAALPEKVQLGIIGFAAVVAAAGPVIYIFGQIVMAASAIVGAFATKGIAARALAGAYNTLAVSAGTVTKALTLLTNAAFVAQAAFVGWQIGRLIADLTGLDTAIDRSVKSFEDLAAARAKMLGATTSADVLKSQISDIQARVESLRKQGFGDSAEVKQFNQRLQTLGSQLDVVNRAISHGAASTISYTDAIKFNEQWEVKRIAALTKGAEAQGKKTAQTQADTGATTENNKESKKRAELLKEIHAASVPLTAEQEAQVISLEKLGISQSKIAEFLGVSATRVDAFTDSLKEQTKAVIEMVRAWGPISTRKLVGPGIFGLDTNQLHPTDLAKSDFFNLTPRNDQLGPIGLDPSKLNLGNLAEWGKSPQGFWGSTFGSPAQFGSQLAGTIIGAVQGGGNPVSAAAGMVGSKIGSSIAGSLTKEGGKLFNTALGGVFNAALPVVGSLIGPLVDKLWGSLFGTKGRDTKLELAKQLFGSVEEMQRQLVTLGQAQYDRLWKQFSEVGQNNQGQAEAAIKAITAALDAQKKKQEEVAAAAAASAQAQQQALDEIGAKYKTEIDKLESELKSLSDSVAQEAEEEVMGIVEMQQRARIKEIEAEKAAQEAMRDAEIAAKKQAFDVALGFADQLDEKLTGMERGYKIPIRFELPDGWPTAPSSIPSADALSAGMASGISAGSRVALSAGAGLRAGEGGTTTVQVNMDGRRVAEAVVPHIPGRLAVIGVGR